MRGRFDWDVGEVSRLLVVGGLCVDGNIVNEGPDPELLGLNSDCESVCDAT